MLKQYVSMLNSSFRSYQPWYPLAEWACGWQPFCCGFKSWHV